MGNSAFLAFLLIFAALATNRNKRFVWFMAVTTVLLSIAANAWSGSLSQTRYLLMTFPLLAMLIGIGVAQLARTGISPVFPLSIWLLWGGMEHILARLYCPCPQCRLVFSMDKDG